MIEIAAYDVLFWLFIAMLGSLAFAVEAGVATRHRGIVLSSLFSVLVTTVYMMLLVDEKSSLNLGPRPGALNEGEGDDTEKGSFEFNKKKGKGGVAPGGNGGRSGKAPGGDDPNAKSRAGQSINDCEKCPAMVVVPKGQFNMGSPITEQGRQSFEGPGNQIHLAREFAIGRMEVTVEEFAYFIRESGYSPSRSCVIEGHRRSANWDNPGHPQGPKHPVVCISYNDAKTYTDWLSKKTNRKYRLPSESQWEYAARAGTTTAYWQGPIIAEGRANFGRSNQGTVPVGFSAANAFGLHDTAGNVWEITEDCWNADVSYASRDGRPVNLLGDCSQRAIKGGGWDSPAEHLRSAMRGITGEGSASSAMGLRIARDLDPND